MTFLDLTLPTPAENLAGDEALLDWFEENGGDGVLRFWEPANYFVVVGYARPDGEEPIIPPGNTLAPQGRLLTACRLYGVDEVVVYDGELTLSSAFSGPSAGPKDFDIIIALQSPFYYDPRAGNLLLDEVPGRPELSEGDLGLKCPRVCFCGLGRQSGPAQLECERRGPAPPRGDQRRRGRHRLLLLATVEHDRREPALLRHEDAHDDAGRLVHRDPDVLRLEPERARLPAFVDPRLRADHVGR